MERTTTIITIPDAHKAKNDRDEKSKLRMIAFNGRYNNHQLIIQYSDMYLLESLYTPDIRALIDGNWVIALACVI